ncbi:hypothetical protein GCM10009613_05510 [Pseudonocardia kongjuensis]|uniref:FmdE, Molybdenum formylmethanofuran dehydrogenase operon n=1 Tax=Pseudonocardia kongjuensis TaxID=102227 RepID=A0ABP4I8T2_9PSEU
MEYKTAALASPTPARPAGRKAERVTAVLGPIGVEHRGQLIERGALAEAIRDRLPAVAIGHDWLRGCGVVVTSGVEVRPGDPRLPAITSEGDPWPVGGGGIVLAVDLMPGTTANSKLAVKAARAAGPRSAWSFGFKVIDGSFANGARRIRRPSVYTICPPATDTEVKAAAPYGLEVKGMTSRTIYPVFCGRCQVGKMRTDRPLIGDQPFECEQCAREDALNDPWADDQDTPDAVARGRNRRGVLTPAQLRELDELTRITSEDAYGEAVDDEVEHDVDADGTLGRARPDRDRWRP